MRCASNPKFVALVTMLTGLLAVYIAGCGGNKSATPAETAEKPLAPATSGYHLLKTVPLPGTGNSFWDYLKLDPNTHQLFIAHGDHVDVVRSPRMIKILIVKSRVARRALPPLSLLYS